jgi:hypothetical protein
MYYKAFHLSMTCHRSIASQTKRTMTCFGQRMFVACKQHLCLGNSMLVELVEI